MKPVEIDRHDGLDKYREKMDVLIEDIYRKFQSIQDKVYDFVGEEPYQQAGLTSAEADEAQDSDTSFHEQNTDTDLNAAFEATLKDCDNHTNGSTNFVLAQQAAEADLSQTITDPPTQAEVQAISNKIDALLAKLRSANVLAT